MGENERKEKGKISLESPTSEVQGAGHLGSSLGGVCDYPRDSCEGPWLPAPKEVRQADF